MKKIILNKNKTKCINPKGYFYHSTDGKLSQSKTLIFLNYDGKFLTVSFWGDNDFFLTNNIYKNIYGRENQPLYNQEVFEIFIGNGKESPTEYLEFNINPNNALYGSKIINEDKEGFNNKNILLTKNETKSIKHFVKKNINKKTWRVKLCIPMKMINANYQNCKSHFYRLNFFRIRNVQQTKNKQWHCDYSNCEFSCWNSTNSKTKPRFHRSEAMGLLEIIN